MRSLKPCSPASGPRSGASRVCPPTHECRPRCSSSTSSNDVRRSHRQPDPLAAALLFADGGKVPQRVAQWRLAVVEPLPRSNSNTGAPLRRRRNTAAKRPRGCAVAADRARGVQRHVPNGVRRDAAGGGGHAPPCACCNAARAAGAAPARWEWHCVHLNPATGWQSGRRLS